MPIVFARLPAALRTASRTLGQAALLLVALATPAATVHAADPNASNAVAQRSATFFHDAVGVPSALRLHLEARAQPDAVSEILIPGLAPMRPAPMPALDPAEFSARPSMSHVPVPWSREELEQFEDLPPVIAEKFGLPTAEAGQPAMLKAAAVGDMQPLEAFALAWPARGDITTYFGHVGPYSPSGHDGIDIAAPEGTPIYAAFGGVVKQAAFTSDGYGGLVVVDHGNGYETWYAHLSAFKVQPGDRVERGEIIAAMGSTGYSTGSHLHFEVREGGVLKDPMGFIK